MNRAARLAQLHSKGSIRSFARASAAKALALRSPAPIGLGLAVLSLLSLGCVSPPGSGDGSTPIAIEYRLASFSRGSFPVRQRGLDAADCLSGTPSETLKYTYPSGRRVSVAVSSSPGFALDLWQGQVLLHEMPLEDGLEVAARAELTIDERRMTQARKFKAKHATCEFVVMVDGAVADLVVGATSWDDALPAGRFPTLDRAREVFERPNLSIVVVPEPLELTRWRRDFRRWQARDTRWRFRCDPAFRANMKRNRPETYARLAAQDQFTVGQACGAPPRPPQHPGR